MRIRSIAVLTASLALAAGVLSFTSPASAAEAPAVGDCLRDSNRSFWDPFTPAKTVDCSQSHTAEVTHVGTYPDELPAPSEVGDQIYDYWDQMCPFSKTKGYLQKSQPKIVVRTSGALKLPTDEQWAQGDRAVACIVVVPTLKGKHQSWKGSLPGLLAGGTFTQFLGCQRSKPKTGVWVDHGPCTSAKQWLLVAGVSVKGKATSDPYPGAAVQKAAEKACAKVAKKYTKKGTSVTFVASVAPEELWNDGVRFAECTIPYANYNGKR
jgi:hypothetical protein